MDIESKPPCTAENPGTSPLVVSADFETEELLRRHAAGEKLTPQQYGKVGNYRAKLNRAAGKAPGRPPASRNTGEAPTDQPSAPDAASEAEPPIPGPVEALACPDAASDSVRRCFAAMLQACDEITQNVVRSAATSKGLPEKACNRISSAAGLPPALRNAMAETSPDLCAALNIKAEKMPLAVWAGGVSAWAVCLTRAIMEIKSLADSKPAPPPT